MSPHSTLNRPGTRHTVFTMENREWEGTGTNGNEEHTQQKNAALLNSSRWLVPQGYDREDSKHAPSAAVADRILYKRMCWLYYFILALWMHLSIILNKLLIIFYKGKIILGDPGADSGGEGKSKQVGKMARRKVKNGEESAWGQSFNRPVPNGPGRSGFWLVQENFVFFCPIRGDLGVLFVCSYLQSTWSSQLFAMFILAIRGGCIHRGEKIQCQNKIQGKTFRISTIISPANALDLSQVSTLFENHSLCTDVPLPIFSGRGGRLYTGQKIKANSANVSWTLAWENIRYSKSRRFALCVPWRRETYFKSSKCLVCQ